MKSIKPIVLFFFCFLVTFSVNAQNRVSITWEVLKYDLVVSLPDNYSASRDLNTVATLNLKNVSNRTFSQLTMRINDNAEISTVSVNGSTADFRKREEGIGGSRKLQKAIVSLPPIAPGTTFTVRVNYKFRVKSNSGLHALSPVESQFLPAAFWYPTPNSWVFTGGGDFAPFSLKVNNAAGLTVLSSGVESDNAFDQNLNGQPFFITGRWETLELKGVKVFIPRGSGENGTARANELASLLSEANQFVSNFSGSAAQLPLRIVSVNRGAGFSDSGTVFVDDSVFRRAKLDAQTVNNIAEAAAKFWLGNVVEVKGVGFGVIREGLAKFIATEFIEKKFGKDVADIERLKQRIDYSAIASRDAPLSVVSPVDGYYFTSNANKGAMIWKYLYLKFRESFASSIQAAAADGSLTLEELREVFSSSKDYLDYMLDKNTTMNLMIGSPQYAGNQTKVALRNVSEVIANVDVVGHTASGQKLVSNVTIPANGFSEAVFRSPNKVVRVEIDAQKIYPQTNYIDDVAPRGISENDPVLFIKRDFDRREFNNAEKNARLVLGLYPHFDEAKILLGRSLLAQDKMAEAGNVFREALAEKLPSARSLAWANVGLGEIAAKTGQNSNAMRFFTEVIRIDAEYGATLVARRGRNALNIGGGDDPAIAKFFSEFDSVAKANNKAGIDSLVLTGEVGTFVSGIAGQAQEWRTTVKWIDQLDPENVLVEAEMNVRLLSRENESGVAVYRLTKVGGGWKLSGVEIFEVG